MARQNSSNNPIPGNKTVLQKLNTKRRGFTRVQFVLVVVVIAVVAVIAAYNVRRSRKREQARAILEDLRELDTAIDQFAIEGNAAGGAAIRFSYVLKDIKPGTRLYTSSGRDILGNPFTITTLDKAPKISDASYKALSDVVPADFWSPFR
jgi:type II secretory pathway pseudopilin PulG